MTRRDLIALLGGAVASWPVGVRAQQPDRIRRIGVLMNVAADDPEALPRVGAFSQRLAELGWTIGHNVRIDYRWYAANADAARNYAMELVALAPDVILASGTLGVTAMQQITRPVPIVFTLVTDPVGAGFVNSLARPGGNTTASCCQGRAHDAPTLRCSADEARDQHGQSAQMERQRLHLGHRRPNDRAGCHALWGK